MQEVYTVAYLHLVWEFIVCLCSKKGPNLYIAASHILTILWALPHFRFPYELNFLMCAWTCLWVMWKTHIRTNTSRFWEIILSLRFLIFQYGIVYHLHVDEHSTRLDVSTGITLVSVSSFPMAVTCHDSQLKKRKTVVKPKLLSDSNVVCCLMWYTSWFSCLQGFPM
jgi:hypothetical protein